MNSRSMPGRFPRGKRETFPAIACGVLAVFAYLAWFELEQRGAELRAAVAAMLCASLCVLAFMVARYWTAMETSSIGVVMVDIDGQWQWANPAMCDMLGYTMEEMIAMPSWRHTPPQYRERRRELFENYAAGSIADSRNERPFLHKDGHEVWVHITATKLEGSQGAPAVVISHARDITDQRAARLALQALNRDLEDRIQQRTRELTQANADLEAFSYSAAHDLRSPLGRIVGYMDLLAREPSTGTERAQKWMGSIRRQALEMDELIERLLSLSRAARADIAPRAFSMEEMCAQLRSQFAHSHPAESLRATWRVSYLPQAWGDPALVRVALTNLLENALKYSRHAPSPCIEVGAFQADEPGMCGYYVRDNGAGFDMAQASGLFTPFKRMHAPRDFEGNGIGLAIVHRVITRTGGRIWAHAERGCGATFYFTLPCAEFAPSA